MALSEDYVRHCYRFILGRDPSPDEVAHWIASGVAEEELRQGFISSPEFKARYREVKGSPGWEPNRGQVAINIRIPKTAGTSLTYIMAISYEGTAMIVGDDADPMKLRQLNISQRRRVTFVAGHLNYGVGDLFPQRVVYLTTLREPRERVYSFYRYIRRRDDHPLHGLVNSRCATFGDFLELAAEHGILRSEVDNGQVRRLAGDVTAAGFDDTPTLYQWAMHHLFAPDMLFGISEKFGDFVQLLVERGIIPKAGEANENTPPGNEPRLAEALAGASDEQLRLFDEFTRWDSSLYAAAAACYN